MKRLAVGFVAAALGAAASPAAFAGPVTSGTGTVTMTFDTPSDSGSQTVRTFPVAFPGSETVEFDGNGNDDIGLRGLGRAVYALSDTGSGANFDVQVSTQNQGGPVSNGSDTTFSFSFTTDRALHYKLDATRQFGNLTNLRFDDYSATAEVDVMGEGSGTWPADVGPGGVIREFLDVEREGELAAGTHSLFLEVAAGIERDGDGGRGNAGLRLALAAADDGGPSPTPVPLPAAVWPGVATLGGILTATAARRRRATT